MRLSLTFSLCALLLVGGAESFACRRDLKKCPDGSAVQRDPANNCDFPKCDCRLPRRWRVLGGHYWCLWMGEQVGSCMAFEERWSHPDCGCGCRPRPVPTPAPPACDKDVKRCPDGSVVTRDERNNCQFPKCGCRLPQGWSLLKKGMAGHISCQMMNPVTCQSGEEMWSIADCGCGCRPAARVPTPPVPIPAPPACDRDMKRCPDGSVVARDEKNNCQFPKCGCRLPRGWSVVRKGMAGHISCQMMNPVRCWSGEEMWSIADCGCGCRPRGAR